MEEINKNPDQWVFDRREGDQFIFQNINKKSDQYFLFPKAVEKEIFWVRETWQESECFDYHIKNEFVYRANKAHAEFANEHNVRWNPSIFMPKEACRLFLEVTNVRVERLKDISSEDAIAEGISHTTRYKGVAADNYMNYLANRYEFTGPGLSFYSLWESINGRASLQLNPWVWVYTFKRIEKPETFNQ